MFFNNDLTLRILKNATSDTVNIRIFHSVTGEFYRFTWHNSSELRGLGADELAIWIDRVANGNLELESLKDSEDAYRDSIAQQDAEQEHQDRLAEKEALEGYLEYRSKQEEEV